MHHHVPPTPEDLAIFQRNFRRFMHDLVRVARQRRGQNHSIALAPAVPAVKRFFHDYRHLPTDQGYCP